MAVVVEPWTLMHLADRPVEERAAAVRALPRFTTPPKNKFGQAPLSGWEEFEIAVQYLLWMGATGVPLLSLLWLAIRPCAASALCTVFCALSMLWPNREWPVPPANRLSMPLRNRKVASAFIRYFPMRVVVEAPDEVIPSPEEPAKRTRGPLLLAGVPHGLFPIGFVLLGFCSFALPWRRMRAAAASVTLKLPIWRQVSLWNGGIDVSKRAIIKALRGGDDVLVAMDGIAGAFAGSRQGKHGSAHKETFLLRRRRGLVKIALETGTPLVPFVCFGNTKAVTPVTDSFGIMESISRWLGVSLIYPGGRGLLPIPRRVPVTVVIGPALAVPSPSKSESGGQAGTGSGTTSGAGEQRREVSEEEVDALHARLIKEHSALYYRWREAGGYGDVELEIV